jgi:glycosyltransferase involved in cell wall biosynthesis
VRERNAVVTELAHTRVSLVATVWNEIESVDAWLAGIAAQTRLPDEVVIVDGGSSDGTWERLAAWDAPTDIRCILVPGAGISEGRNHAIAAARGEFVVVTDAGTRARPDWLEQLIESFTPETDVVCGFFIPDATTVWERALAATTLPDTTEIVAERFLPSSRSVAFRRSWWETGVRYPAWLDYCEDLVWDLSLLRAGARFAFAESAVVQFRVRPSPRDFAVQYYRYARGDGKAGLFPRRHGIRYLTWFGLVLGVLRHNRIEIGAIAVLGAAYCATPVRRLWQRDRQDHRAIRATLLAMPLIPLQRALGDLAKMAGYPAGLHWRNRTFGSLGWRTSWRRISPEGSLYRSAHSARESQAPPS